MGRHREKGRERERGERGGGILIPTQVMVYKVSNPSMFITEYENFCRLSFQIPDLRLVFLYLHIYFCLRKVRFVFARLCVRC